MSLGIAQYAHRTLAITAMLALLTLAGCDKPAPPTARFVPETAATAKKPEADDGKKADKKAETSTDDDAPPRPDADKKKPDTDPPGLDKEDMPPTPQTPPEDADELFPRRIHWTTLLEGDQRQFFPRDADWINSAPLDMKDLKGKFVILDFWTYCCINCMHILPELKKLEHKYPNELVVIGVHSAKFDEEKDSQNIADAVLRYEIEHPVVNDSEHIVWKNVGVRSWPTVALIDPEGNLVGGRSGEFKAEEFIAILDEAIAFYEKKGRMDRTPLKFDLLAKRTAKTPLRYPGKILADEPGGRLFISDSNHNRIVIASLEGKLLDTIGTGAMGKQDGGYAEATFDHPQGCALVGETLYVADTENHLLRKVDLKDKKVTTIAGTGKQAGRPWPGFERLFEEAQKAALEGREQPEIPDHWSDKPLATPLNSPWALWAHDGTLYIAMAGPHQIWKMPLDESEISVYAGNGREDIVDGPLVPTGRDALDHSLGYSSFAQPSGLSSDGVWLFVADSEGSSIRAVPFDPTKEVRTVLGTNELPGGRLFDFGDVDGDKATAKLQHPLEVVFHEGTIYVADTYNNKIKAIDAETGDTKTFAGTGKPGRSDDEPTFDEPAGLALAAGKLYVADTNNSLIRTVDIASGKVSTLVIEGLAPPTVSAKESAPDFSTAPVAKGKATSLKATEGKVTLNVQLELPEGWKINPLAPASYYIDEPGEAKLIEPAALGKHALDKPAANFAVELPTKGTGETKVTVSMNIYYCQESDNGVCKIAAVVFEQPLTISDDAESSSADLLHIVTDDAP